MKNSYLLSLDYPKTIKKALKINIIKAFLLFK